MPGQESRKGGGKPVRRRRKRRRVDKVEEAEDVTFVGAGRRDQKKGKTLYTGADGAPCALRRSAQPRAVENEREGLQPPCYLPQQQCMSSLARSSSPFIFPLLSYFFLSLSLSPPPPPPPPPHLPYLSLSPSLVCALFAKQGASTGATRTRPGASCTSRIQTATAFPLSHALTRCALAAATSAHPCTWSSGREARVRGGSARRAPRHKAKHRADCLLSWGCRRPACTPPPPPLPPAQIYEHDEEGPGIMVSAPHTLPIARCCCPLLRESAHAPRRKRTRASLSCRPTAPAAPRTPLLGAAGMRAPFRRADALCRRCPARGTLLPLPLGCPPAAHPPHAQGLTRTNERTNERTPRLHCRCNGRTARMTSARTRKRRRKCGTTRS